MQPLHAGGALAHRSRVVKKLLKDNHIPSCVRVPGIFPGLKPHRKCLELYKNKVQEAHSTNIQTLKEVLMKL